MISNYVSFRVYVFFFLFKFIIKTNKQLKQANYTQFNKKKTRMKDKNQIH